MNTYFFNFLTMFNITPNLDFDPRQDQFNALKHYIKKFQLESNEIFTRLYADKEWFKDIIHYTVDWKITFMDYDIYFVDWVWTATEFTYPVYPAFIHEDIDNLEKKWYVQFISDIATWKEPDVNLTWLEDDYS